MGHTFYLIWPCSYWGRQKVGVRKIHTHTQRIVRACVRACVWLVSGQWLVSYTPLLTGQPCLFVWPPDNLGPHIFSLLYLKKQICCSAPSCSPSIYLSSFLSFLQTKVFRTWQCFPSYGCMAKYDEILSEETFLILWLLVNLFQKLLFFQNMGRTCCVYKLF